MRQQAILLKPARRARGFGLFDALVSLMVLSLGMLAMTRFQNRMVAQTTESNSRQVATQLAAEHLSTVLVDVKNAACYTLPQAGAWRPRDRASWCAEIRRWSMIFANSWACGDFVLPAAAPRARWPLKTTGK